MLKFLTVYKEIIFQLHILRNRMRHMPTDKAGARSRTLLGIRSHCNEINERKEHYNVIFKPFLSLKVKVLIA